MSYLELQNLTKHFTKRGGVLGMNFTEVKAVDGVSLTLVDVLENEFSVALIPHTLQVTTLGRLQVGDTVNIETDILAKYVQQQLNRSKTV